MVRGGRAPAEKVMGGVGEITAGCPFSSQSNLLHLSLQSAAALMFLHVLLFCIAD